MTDQATLDPTKLGWITVYEQSKEQRVWDDKPLDFLIDYYGRLREAGVRGIVDIGCGEGRNLEGFAEQGFATIGLDLSNIALSRAYAAARARGIAHSALICADIDQLPAPFVPGTLEAISCLDVFGQLLVPQRVMRGVYDALAPGGFFLTNLYTPGDASYGEGKEIGPKTYLYNNDTLFRFFEDADLPSLLGDFEILDQSVRRWVDPPHPGFRDYEHTHESIVLFLRRPLS